MNKYKYKLITNRLQFPEEITELGNEGWELVSVV